MGQPIWRLTKASVLFVKGWSEVPYQCLSHWARIIHDNVLGEKMCCFLYLHKIHNSQKMYKGKYNCLALGFSSVFSIQTLSADSPFSPESSERLWAPVRRRSHALVQLSSPCLTKTLQGVYGVGQHCYTAPLLENETVWMGGSGV